MKSLAALLLSSAASAKLLFPDVAPKGFNTFDNYTPNNQTEDLKLATEFANVFGPSGYEYFTLDGGWDAGFDEYGVPIANTTKYPNMKQMSAELRQMGLKFGLWTVRGVHISQVEKKVPVRGTNYTVDELVDQAPVGGGANGSCLWAHEWLGINSSHPGAYAYYKNRVDTLVNLYDVDFIKADCMMCSPCYTGEMELFTRAMKESPRDLVLYYSPGGGNTPKDGEWVAGNRMATMYRVTTDFHGGWYGWAGLQQAMFVAGNFSAAGLNGKNNTYMDLDMIPMSDNWWNGTQELHDRGQTIATLWMMSRSPLTVAGKLYNPKTAAYLTNPIALEVHDKGVNNSVHSYEGNCTCKGNNGICSLPRPAYGPPCIATWKATVGTWTAISVTNMGENTTTHTTKLSDIGVSSPATLHNIWTGESKTVHDSFDTPLNMHASEFYKIEGQN
eukprot:TRINITY_DN834_c2_g1_i1.p1 TRINITY_DN834_c2_g1~~TRINITY_DN834_c2_g1_i1.p1  ORF type:complete len:457 (+),score=117.13 TRINITY_DN834_c2_g1_i1:41-1372(+)